MQNTGLLDSINAMRAIAVEYRQPICMMVGLQGKEPDRSRRNRSKYSVRIVEPLLDVMGIEHHLLSVRGRFRRSAPAFERARYETSCPVVMLYAGVRNKP